MYKYDAESKLIKSYVYDSETMTNSFGTDVIYDLQSRVSSVQLTFDYVAPSGTYVESYMLVYIYDENGSPIGMKYRTPNMAQDVYECFFFGKNLQGDIVSVYNSSGVKVIAYTYDAWGNFIQTHTGGGASDVSIATKNPFRYRGYYYDTNTGFYYLQSRYYNPQWGRFLNADKYVNANGDIVGFNMFAYCSNNPIAFIDPTGEGFWSDLWGGIKKLFVSFWESLDFSIGAGSGFGISAETGLIEAEAVTKADVICIEKKAEETDVYVGCVSETSVSIESAGFVIQGGEKIYHDPTTGEIIKTEKLYPEVDSTVSVGYDLYVFVGFHISFGFDFKHFFEQVFSGDQ